jgi:DNA polymerase III delta prime subunit
VDWKDIWTEKYRPKTLDDIILSDDTRSFLSSLKENSKETGGVPNILFSGPPGTGKTSISKIIANDILNCDYIYINGSEESSIDTVRNKIMGFAQTKSFDGKLKMVIIDEMEGMSSSNFLTRTSAQQALRNVMEEYSSNTRFIFTTNYPDRIIEPIHSRVLHVPFNLTKEDCIKKVIYILKSENVKIPDDQKIKLKNLVEKLCPDLRNIIIQLQKFSSDNVLNITTFKSNKDFCYNILSMLIKKENVFSIREYVVNHEKDFFSDYHELLTGMFNSILNDQIDMKDADKIKASLIISDSIVDHFTVSDKEVNFTACLFRLSQM